MPLLPIYTRIDGRCFSGFTSGLERPYDLRITRAMVETTKHLVEETHARIGYTQSDEISLVWQQDRYDSEVFFGGKVQKLVSVLAGLASVRFNHACLADDALRERATKMMPVFDCRVFPTAQPRRGRERLPVAGEGRDEERHQHGRAQLLPGQELHGKTSSQMQEMIFQKGQNFNDYPAFFKRGTFVRRITEERPVTPTIIDRGCRVSPPIRPPRPARRHSGPRARMGCRNRSLDKREVPLQEYLDGRPLVVEAQLVAATVRRHAQEPERFVGGGPRGGRSGPGPRRRQLDVLAVLAPRRRRAMMNASRDSSWGQPGLGKRLSQGVRTQAPISERLRHFDCCLATPVREVGPRASGPGHTSVAGIYARLPCPPFAGTRSTGVALVAGQPLDLRHGVTPCRGWRQRRGIPASAAPDPAGGRSARRRRTRRREGVGQDQQAGGVEVAGWHQAFVVCGLGEAGHGAAVPSPDGLRDGRRAGRQSPEQVADEGPPGRHLGLPGRRLCRKSAARPHTPAAASAASSPAVQGSRRAGVAARRTAEAAEAAAARGDEASGASHAGSLDSQAATPARPAWSATVVETTSGACVPSSARRPPGRRRGRRHGRRTGLRRPRRRRSRPRPPPRRRAAARPTNRCQIRLQHAAANSRALRSVSLPLFCKTLSILSGSPQAAHSRSSTASLLAQQEVQRRTTPDVLPWSPQVPEDLPVAPRILQCVGQHQQAGRCRASATPDATGSGRHVHRKRPGPAIAPAASASEDRSGACGTAAGPRCSGGNEAAGLHCQMQSS